jgi:hypothetical protein
LFNWEKLLVNLTVKMVELAEVEQYWPMCEPLIGKGLEPCEGEADAKHVLIEVQARRAQLIVGIDSTAIVHVAMVVQFMPYPNYTVAHVYSIGGRGVIENTQHWASLKAWMKQQGATKVQGVCKPAQARLWQKLGFVDTYHLVRQSL